MLEAIISTLTTMGWLGIVLAILVLVNTACGTICNVSNGESFSWKRLLKGLGKAVVFYASSAATAVAFTMLPYINEMITTGFGVTLISTEMLNTLSSVAVLSIVVATIIVQAKKAIESITNLSNTSVGCEKITWEVEEENEEE